MSMRRALPAEVPKPDHMVRALPGPLQDDDFARRLVSVFDEALSPVFLALDNLPAYLDPSLAPEDFVDWMASWLGLPAGREWPLERRRVLLAGGPAVVRERGTLEGLARHIELLTGTRPEVADSGGVSCSRTADSPLPGSPRAELRVRVRLDDPDALDRVRALVEAERPAHVVATVEVIPA
jgi:phage tail-like protein